jgi:hypothetical protein
LYPAAHVNLHSSVEGSSLYDRYVEGNRAEFTHDWVMDETVFGMAFVGSGAQSDTIGSGVFMVAKHSGDDGQPAIPPHDHVHGPYHGQFTVDGSPTAQRLVISPDVLKDLLLSVQHSPGVGVMTALHV